jgi:phage baseplate assembly protein W
MRPNFGCGIHDYVFESVDAYVVGRLEREIRIAIDRWEPRIEITQISVDTSEAEAGRLPIEVEYVVRATNDRRNLVYPFYVIPAEE